MSEPLKEENLNEFIQNAIDTNDVVVFMKGTKKFPMCGFSGTVVSIFNALGVDFADYNALDNGGALRMQLRTFSDWPTLPQIYIKGEFIGGCDITREMYQSGELQALLKEKGILA